MKEQADKLRAIAKEIEGGTAEKVRRLLKENNKLLGDITELRETNSRITKDNETLQKEASRLAALLDQAEAKEIAKEILQEKLDHCWKSLEAARAGRNEYKQRLEAIELLLSSKQEQFSGLSERFERLNEERNALYAQVTAKDALIKDISEKAVQTNTENARLRLEVNDRKEILADAHRRAGELAQKNAFLEDSISRHGEWRDKAMDACGVNVNISFDDVFWPMLDIVKRSILHGYLPECEKENEVKLINAICVKLGRPARAAWKDDDIF